MADHRPINRRAALLAGGALALAAGAPRTALGRSGDFAFDVRDPVANMEAAVRMMGSNDGSVTYGYNRGRLLGMRPREHARPLADWEGCAARVFKRRDDGAFDLGLREWLYFLDMDTGEPATAMLNPYTLEEIQLTPFKGGGGLGHAFSTHGQGRSGRTGYEAEHGPYVYDWMAVGGLAHLQIDKFISFPAFYSPERFPRASTGSTRWEVQVQTLIGPIDELNDPGRPCVRTSEVWMMKNDWMGFMNMGQWSGHHSYGQALRESGLYKRYGGFYLMSGPPVEAFENPYPARRMTLIAQFPCREAAQGFYYSAAYQNIIPLRDGAGTFQFGIWPLRGLEEMYYMREKD